MEKLKKPHDHTFTKILKVAIFGLFLILPILTWMPTAFYYGFNEHAVNNEISTITETRKYKTNEVNANEDLILNNYYVLSYKYAPSTATTNLQEFQPYNTTWVEFINANDNDYFFNCETIYYHFKSNLNNGAISYREDIIKFCSYSVRSGVAGCYVDYYWNGEVVNNGAYDSFTDSSTLGTNLINGLLDFKLIVKYGDVTSLKNLENEYTFYSEIPEEYNPIINVTETTKETEITEHMYKAWATTWKSDLLNWTGNTNFSFTINTFVNVFGISEESYLTNYITYLITLTAIYVIFDIVLEIFIKLTHMLNE